jgi:hypothetical protein
MAVIPIFKWPNNIPTFSIPGHYKIYPNWYFWLKNIPSGNPGFHGQQSFAVGRRPEADQTTLHVCILHAHINCNKVYTYVHVSLSEMCRYEKPFCVFIIARQRSPSNLFFIFLWPLENCIQFVQTETLDYREKIDFVWALSIHRGYYLIINFSFKQIHSLFALIDSMKCIMYYLLSILHTYE